MKRCLIVYDSYHHGNTKKVAEAMAEVSGAELCPAADAADRDLSAYDVVGFGSGIAYGKPYEALQKAAARLDLAGKTAFVFSTCGSGNTHYNDFFEKKLKEAGANVAGGFSCRGFDTVGPFKLVGGIAKGHPDDADLAAAKKFAADMVREG